MKKICVCYCGCRFYPAARTPVFSKKRFLVGTRSYVKCPSCGKVTWLHNWLGKIKWEKP